MRNPPADTAASEGRQLPRFYLQPRPALGIAVEHVLALPEKLAHHVRVLRLEAGDKIVLFDGSGGEYLSSLEGVGKHTVMAKLDAFSPREAEPAYRIVLAQSVAGGDKMDWVVEKAVELGVHAIQPLLSARGVVRLSGERATRRVAHWQALAAAACEQCGRNRVPLVLPLLNLENWLAKLDGQPGMVMAPSAATSLAEVAGGQTIGSARREGRAINLLVGPEGGFAPEEEAQAIAAGLVAVKMGERVLRCETAGPAALAALATIWGEF
ncbi:MAG: 16S rRNA (uracil(1498)-N(3))-methyltransferase [Candidatus Protistobacter heckmanni]|nr:16S rRNA (uracil(1498)-N(3))-methyltransferase [Candidatus Protistobacter heckmanni]